MGWFLCKQPNGLFAQFSTSYNTFYGFNMTEQDVLKLAFEEWDIGKNTALAKLKDAKDDTPPIGPAGWVSGVRAHLRLLGDNAPVGPFRWQMALTLLRDTTGELVSYRTGNPVPSAEDLIKEAIEIGSEP